MEKENSSAEKAGLTPQSFSSQKSSHWPILGLVFSLFLCLGIILFLVYQNYQLRKQVGQLELSQTSNKQTSLDEPISSPTTSPSSPMVLGECEFILDQIKIGDQVCGMEVRSIEKIREDWPIVDRDFERPTANAKVSLSGEATITGNYSYRSMEPFGKGDILCFKDYQSGQGNFPQIAEGICDTDLFCFENEKLARTMLPNKNKDVKATIIIDNLVFSCYPTSPMFHRAELVSVLDQ